MSPIVVIWNSIQTMLSSTVFENICLLLIIGAEIHAIYHNHQQTMEARKQTTLADDTYKLYHNYFEVTEKRKADAREKAAATRAAKKERAANPDPPAESEIVEPPMPPNGKVPPPMTLPDDDETPEEPGNREPE